MGERDAWFRSPDWGPAVERDFRNRIARSRSDSNRSQYIRIKALSLLKSPATRASGQALLREVIDAYPAQRLQLVMALEDLGQSLEEDGDFCAAEETYRTCQFQARRGIGGYSHRCAFMLARLIVASGQRSEYAEAEKLLEQAVNYRHGFFNSELFEFAVLRARLAREIGDETAAGHHARRALELARITEPQLPRHPTVGLVNADPQILMEMERLAPE